MIRRPLFLVNPTAAGGRAARWWSAAVPVLRRQFPDLTGTVVADRDQLPDLLAAAKRDGNRTIIGVGGDGTHHAIVNALVSTGLSQDFSYAPLPLGTGNDWCRTLGLPRHLVRWLAVLRQGRSVEHRIGRLDLPGGGTRYFMNVAGLAYDAEVVRRAATHDFKRPWLYPLFTACYLPAYRPPRLRLTYDDQVVEDRFHTINVGIGRYNGGGMRLVPHADPRADDFALTYAASLPVGRIAANGWRFFTDTIGKVEGVITTRARQITVTGPTDVEADGEFLGAGPVTMCLADVRIRVHCGDLRDPSLP